MSPTGSELMLVVNMSAYFVISKQTNKPILIKISRKFEHPVH